MTKDGGIRRGGPEVKTEDVNGNRHILNKHRFKKGLVFTLACFIHGIKTRRIDINRIFFFLVESLPRRDMSKQKKKAYKPDQCI